METPSLLFRLQENTNYIKENIIDITVPVLGIAYIEHGIVGLNRGQLYDEGIDAEGNRLLPYASEKYAQYKLKLRGDGKEIRDLLNTGEFQRNFYLEVEGHQYFIKSSDLKSFALIERNGEAIFGLVPENLEKAFFIIQPELQEICYTLLLK